MSVSAAIDTAIGLVLVYFVLSLVCTVINEYLATWANLRANTLKNSLQQLIDVPRLRTDFYDHGLIDGANDAKGGHVSYLSGETFALALLGSLDPAEPIPGFAAVTQAVQNLPDSNIRDALLAHISTAHGDVVTLRNNVAAWFDRSMDRVSGVYKRYLKVISLAVGFGLAILVNADTIKMGTVLWHDDALRAQMVGSAQQVANQGAKQPPTPSGNAAPATASDVVDAIKNSEAQLRPLPLGWNFSSRILQQSWCAILWFGVVKLFGLVLTALALSLGAPFWFDLLSKFMNVRGAGPKPQAVTNS